MYMLVHGKYPPNEQIPFTSSISVDNLQIHSNLLILLTPASALVLAQVYVLG